MPLPIPYQGQHVGPRRILRITTRRGFNTPRWLQIGIDGVSNPVPWGDAFFEVPADRPVRISAYYTKESSSDIAVTTLWPSSPAVLEYRAPHSPHFNGEIGPPGTVQSRGGWLFGLAIALPIGLLVLIPVAFVIVLVVVAALVT